MMRKISKIAPEWWDYTTLDDEILNDAANLSAEDLPGLAREGFKIKLYNTLEDFYLAEALEYITSWRQLLGLLTSLKSISSIPIFGGWMSGISMVRRLI